MRRSARFVAALVVALALAALTAADLGAKPAGKADRGTAWVSITHVVGSIQVADGDYRDKLLGRGTVMYRIALLPAGGTVHVVAKTVVLYTGTGSLSGKGSATVLVGKTSETITKGKLSLTKGHGSLAGHSFTGTFTGTANLTTNQIVFHYKGTYK
jgi:hypothetical protein